MAGITLAGLGTIALTMLTWGVKNLISAVLSAKTEIAIFRVELSRVIEDTKSIPKIKEDLNVLHAWRKQEQNKGV